MTPRRILAVAAGRAAGALSRGLGRGGGSALPGLVASSLDPDLLAHLARQVPRGALLVTGTNGKTTTSRMIAEALRSGGYVPLQNRTGSNLLRGLLAAFLPHASLGGALKVADSTMGIFEVDEAVLPLAVPLIRPRAVLITNLFRDQLDRYGEVDTVRCLWQEAVASLPQDATLVLNADDPAVASLGTFARGPVLYYGIEDCRAGISVLEHAADSLNCLSCGRPYEYSAILYSHLGHYRCPRCGAGRPEPQVSAGRISSQSFDRTQYEMETPQGRAEVSLNLGGLYNVYNALAAAAAVLALGVPLAVVKESLARFAPAFGRMERLDIDGRRVCLILVKNPTGFNQVLRTLGQGLRPRSILMVLNDQIADGQDVSWIWDVDFEVLAPSGGTAHEPLLQEPAGPVGEAHELPLPQPGEAGVATHEPSPDEPTEPGTPPLLLASGLRAEDLALRLKYAGLPVPQGSVERDLARALDLALEATPAGDTLCILPTYTAMLAMQRLLARRGHVRHHWEEA